MASNSRAGQLSAADAGKSSPPPAKGAFLFVLEDLVVDGRGAVAEIWRELIQKKRVNAVKQDFFKHNLSGCPAAMWPGLLGEEGTRDPGLLEEVNQRALEGLVQKAQPVSPLLARLLRGAAERDLAPIAISGLPEATAQRVMENSKLTDYGAVLFLATEVDAEFPKADLWVRAARSQQRKLRLSAAAVCSGTVARSAIRAGVRFVALPDEVTEFDGFPGAALVVEPGEEPTVPEIFERLLQPA